MNALVDSFGGKVAVLGFPCNQFGHQTNESDAEFLSTLKHVRPGGGFEPKFDVFGKVNVNGSRAHPVFAFLRRALKVPEDDEGIVDSKGNGVADVDYLVSGRDGFDGTTLVAWSPVRLPRTTSARARAGRAAHARANRSALRRRSRART